MFPQREQFLLRHLVQDDITVTVGEQNLDNCDAVWIDNPLCLTQRVFELEKPVIFDAIDWYEEMLVKEGKVHLLREYRKRVELLRNCRHLGLVAQSPLVLQYWLDVEKVEPIVSKVIPNGYDDVLFTPQIFVDNDFPTLVFAGKMGRWYSNLSYFIHYATKNDVRLILCGDGELKNYFESISNENVTFRGFVPIEMLPTVYAKADICIFPVDDCSPIAVSEYMACGRPVLNLGMRLQWLVRDGIEGYCIDAPNQIPKKVEEMLTKKLEMGKNARKRIESFSWKNCAKMFEGLTKELIR